MESEKVIEHARRLARKARAGGKEGAKLKGNLAQACEFLKTYGGPENAFLKTASNLSGSYIEIKANALSEVLDSFAEYVESGLLEAIRPERQAQLDVVSDLLEQAQILLENKKVHPAAPAVLIGATLEEFLRTWIEEEGLDLGDKKPSLSNYAALLKSSELITKQDVKDITSWGGTRNHAAHGEWDEVSDPKKIKIMLDGVNLFLRSNQK